jgi:lipopolysaccharide/colanic/teichoic acid biosynthesis glycosyltransferase
MDAKRLFDVTFSTLGLLILSPLLLIITLCILFDSGRPIIYLQKRMGKDWKEITLFKFRTMNSQRTDHALNCSTKDDKRVTKLGKYLRKYKLDELPQLLNVLRGDMSFVGPRPELPKFAEYYSYIYEEILKVKPGITDLASIEFRDESSLLDSETVDVEKVYLTKILPKKLEYSRIYLKKQGFFYDLELIFKTIYTVIFK